MDSIKQAWRKDQDPNLLPPPTPNVLRTATALSRAFRLIDWDQAIPMAHNLFREPSNRQQWLSGLKHFLVDEYQDFNVARATLH